jgi:5S rRNA maturation endonuclease (ribonuclease M5)
MFLTLSVQVITLVFVKASWILLLLVPVSGVFVFADGDQPGKEFANSLARELPVTVVQFPDGEDANSFYIANGAQSILKKAGLANA